MRFENTIECYVSVLQCIKIPRQKKNVKKYIMAFLVDAIRNWFMGYQFYFVNNLYSIRSSTTEENRIQVLVALFVVYHYPPFPPFPPPLFLLLCPASWTSFSHWYCICNVLILSMLFCSFFSSFPNRRSIQFCTIFARWNAIFPLAKMQNDAKHFFFFFHWTSDIDCYLTKNGGLHPSTTFILVIFSLSLSFSLCVCVFFCLLSIVRSFFFIQSHYTLLYQPIFVELQNICGCMENLFLYWCVQTIDKIYIINAFCHLVYFISMLLQYLSCMLLFFSFFIFPSQLLLLLHFNIDWLTDWLGGWFVCMHAIYWSPVSMMTLWQIWTQQFFFYFIFTYSVSHCVFVCYSVFTIRCVQIAKIAIK